MLRGFSARLFFQESDGHAKDDGERSRKTRGVASKAAVRSFDTQQFLMSAGTVRCSRKYLSGKTIFQRGDAAEVLFFLQKSKVRFAVVSAQGREARLAGE